MAEHSDLVLEHLKHIRATLDAVRDEGRMQGTRLSSVERHLAQLHTDLANHRDEMDGVKTRLDRIETRLGLVDPQH